MSPCGTTVASAAADETIRLWKCFVNDKEKVKKTTQSKSVKETFSLPSSIRQIPELCKFVLGKRDELRTIEATGTKSETAVCNVFQILVITCTKVPI